MHMRLPLALFSGCTTMIRRQRRIDQYLQPLFSRCVGHSLSPKYCLVDATREFTTRPLAFSKILISSPQRTQHVLCRYASSSPNKEEESSTKPQPKQTLVQRFKAMYKDYWYVLIPVHVLTSCVWFGSFYYTAQSGFDIAGALEWLNLPEEIMDKIRHSANSTAGYVTLSYLLYKIFTPLRYTVTLGGTTYMINYLTARGLIKKVPRREELKKMVAGQMDSFKGKSDSLKESIAAKLTPTSATNTKTVSQTVHSNKTDVIDAIKSKTNTFKSSNVTNLSPCAASKKSNG